MVVPHVWCMTWQGNLNITAFIHGYSMKTMRRPGNGKCAHNLLGITLDELTHLPLRDMTISVILKLILEIDVLSTSHETASKWMLWVPINGSGNGSVPSGNKPLPEQMLTQVFVALGYNEFTFLCSTQNIARWIHRAADDLASSNGRHDSDHAVNPILRVKNIAWNCFAKSSWILLSKTMAKTT